MANALVAKHGLARTASHECVDGQDEEVGLRVVIKWPTKEAAENFMADPEYKPHRESDTLRSSIVIEKRDAKKPCNPAWIHLSPFETTQLLLIFCMI